MKAKPAFVPRPPQVEPDLAIDPATTVQLLAGFIKSEVERTGKRRVVLGLSGGIDSALAAYLAAEALTPSGVIGVLMPYRTSSASSLTDAESVVGALGILAERFEIYACGVELANGFGELTDAAEQRIRFVQAMNDKQSRYGERYSLDEDFLAAVAQMPEAGGVALGLDRLVMLASGALRIDQVVWAPPAENT